MKNIVLLFLSFVFCLQIVKSQDIYDSIYVDGRWRTYLTHLPQSYNPAVNYPLVLAFHGGGPLGYQSIQFQSRLSQKSDSAGFIVVYPEGVKVAGNRTWNAGGCCAPATNLNIDDVGFVDVLLDSIFAERAIDTLRVYATGFSNGALLSYRLANQLAHRFAAIAPVAGNLMYYPWAPTRVVPIISFHSYQDLNVPYFGGVTVGTTGTYFPPQDSALGIISSDYSCLNIKDTISHNPGQYDHFRYSNCSCNALIEQYISYDGEHSWPGGLASTGINVSNQFSATYLMWEFFQNYSLGCLSTGTENLYQEKSLQVYPNPFSNKLYSNCQFCDEFNLYDSQGKLIWSGTNIENVDFSDLQRGLYFLKAEKQIQKLIKL